MSKPLAHAKRHLYVPFVPARPRYLMRSRKRSMLCTVSTVHCSQDSGALVNGQTPCSFRHACRPPTGPLSKSMSATKSALVPGQCAQVNRRPPCPFTPVCCSRMRMKQV